MKEAYAKIRAMHEKYGIAYDGAARLLSEDEFGFRVICLQEEYHEFIEAHVAGDLAEAQDALCDLIVFALGTAERMGLHRLPEGFDRVHAANMMKELASSAGDSKRNFAIDLVKPEGWEPPRHIDLVEDNDALRS